MRRSPGYNEINQNGARALPPCTAEDPGTPYFLDTTGLGNVAPMDVLQLGLDADAIQPDVTFQEPYDFLRAYVAGNKFDQTLLDRRPGDSKKMDPARILASRLDQPWTLDDRPMMAPWLSACLLADRWWTRTLVDWRRHVVLLPRRPPIRRALCVQ